MATPSADNILSARQALAAMDAALARADAAVAPFAWRAQTRGYAGLCRMIISQQVSTASANAIWGRFETGLYPDEWNWQEGRDPPDRTPPDCHRGAATPGCPRGSGSTRPGTTPAAGPPRPGSRSSC